MIYTTREEFEQYLSQFESNKQPEFHYDILRARNVNRRLSLAVGQEELNTIYQSCLALDLREITYNKSGSIKKCALNTYGAYSAEPIYNDGNDIFQGVIVTLILGGCLYRFKYGHLQASEKSKITGIKAFTLFKKKAEEFGINIDDYAIDNGEEVKANIPKPTIENYIKGKELQHVYHMDLNSAYPTGTCKIYPELQPVYECFDKNVKNPLNGFFQSKKYGNKCRFAHLSLAGVSDCVNRINYYCKELDRQDFEVLGVNTDGIWYRDRTPQHRCFHDEDEVPADDHTLFKWSNDHKDCSWYAFSDGQYYFKENGKFNVKARGFYGYEQIKPREEWTEEDFFMAMGTLLQIQWVDKVGLIINGKI